MFTSPLSTAVALAVLALTKTPTAIRIRMIQLFIFAPRPKILTCGFSNGTAALRHVRHQAQETVSYPLKRIL